MAAGYKSEQKSDLETRVAWLWICLRVCRCLISLVKMDVGP